MWRFIQSPAMPTPFPMVKAAATVPNAKSFDMSKTDSGKKGSDSQTNDVKADLDLRVGDGSDLGQLSWKKVCRHDWHLAAVGKCDPDADQYVACHKVKHAPADGGRQNIDPHFVHIQQLTEHKSDHEAEQVLRNKFFAQDHQCQHQKSLENIRFRVPSVTAENTQENA